MSDALVWEFVPLDDSGEVDVLKWRACSFYEADEGETLCYWEVFIGSSGLFTVDCTDYAMSDGERAANGSSEQFITLDHAKAFCEDLEYSLQVDLERDDFDVVPALKRREGRNRKLVTR
jgi:hypothetical protein